MSTKPRSFKLLDEYDAAIGKSGKSLIKGKHQGMITYGLADEEDIDLKTWNGIIIGVQGKQTGEFIYNISIVVPSSYPKVPPQVRFTAPKIKMDCVDANGRVHLNKIVPKFKWDPEMNLADVLMAIRENMYDDKVNQQSASLGNTSY
eukprot:TRINITY_DN66336_c7_g2_i1.p1 TRINITY_DN66336_c7_g2~~TRINITY_DN66336_c7_g2_i1.p1  ORF type:complete len:147 (+),score=77.49 TRINITY_DN66336_c7_g2_i1:68-508(+)